MYLIWWKLMKWSKCDKNLYNDQNTYDITIIKTYLAGMPYWHKTMFLELLFNVWLEILHRYLLPLSIIVHCLLKSNCRARHTCVCELKSVLGFNIFSLYSGELATVFMNYSIYPKNPQTKILRRNIENWHWNTIQTKIQTIQKLRKWYVFFEHFKNISQGWF